MQRHLLVFLCLMIPGVALAAMSTQQLQLLVEQEKYAEAVLEGDKILQQNSPDARARFLTAYAYQMTARDEEAISLYRDLIRDSPDLPEPRNNLAMIYLAQGNYDLAADLLVEAINTHSSYSTAYANLSLIYKGIASEAYRRAVSESSEPANYTHEFKLTAITGLDSLAPEADLMQQLASQPQPAPEITAATGAATQTVVNAANEDTLLIEKVRNWAHAWSSKDFDNYLASYASDYRDRFNTHSQWVKYRQKRILRPGDIKVEVNKFTVRQRGANRATVDFTQAFSSPGYSDRVVKRLEFKRVDSQWKIAAERVLSVL